jgi:ferritin
MAKPELIQALNDQIREELASSYIYLALSADLDAQNLTGAAAWFRKQADEERGHAMRLYDFVYDIGGQVVLQALPQPPSGIKTLKDAFTRALAHEKHITASIHKLVRLARQFDDLATESFLMWFVNEQVEEEKTAADILAKVELTGGSIGSQYLIDRDLGKAAAKAEG